jgi:hypothetical protein
MNVFCEYFFNIFLYPTLDRALGIRIDRLIGRQGLFNIAMISGENIIFAFVTSIAIVIKIGFYTVAMHNDNNGVKNEIIIYFGDFFDNLYYLLTTSYIFLSLLLFLTILGGLPGLIFLNYNSYYMIYSMFERNKVKQRYGQLEAISKSFSITKGNRIKLFFSNMILFSSVVLIFLSLSQKLIIYGFEINSAIKLFCIDFIIVYTIRNNYNLDVIDKERIKKEDEMMGVKDKSKKG